MKKIILFALSVTVLVECSKEEPESKTTWIKTEIQFDRPDDKGKGPEGQVFLFSLNGKHPKGSKPYVQKVNNDYLCYLYDVNDEYIFSDYQKSFESDKDPNTGKYINKSSFVIFSDNISYLYNKDEEYLIVMYFYTPLMTGEITQGGHVSTGGYTVAYKKVKFSNDNSVYTKTFEVAPELEPLEAGSIRLSNILWVEW